MADPYQPLTEAEPRFAAMTDGRLVACARRSTAHKLSEQLAGAGLEAGSYPASAPDIRDLLEANRVAEEDMADQC